MTEVFGNEEKEKQVTCGRFNVDGGDQLTGKAPCDGFAIILEGEVKIEDVDKEETAHLKPGDIVHISPGSNLRWGSPTTGSGVYIALKPLGDLSYRDDIY